MELFVGTPDLAVIEVPVAAIGHVSKKRAVPGDELIGERKVGIFRYLGFCSHLFFRPVNETEQRGGWLESDGMVVRNVCKLQKAPKVAESEMVIVQDVPGLVAKLRGSRLYVPAMVALFTGMRLGEVLALRWGRVDLDSKVVQVREALEPTKARHPLQGAQVQGRPPGHHPARYCWSRRCGSTVRPRSNCG